MIGKVRRESMIHANDAGKGRNFMRNIRNIWNRKSIWNMRHRWAEERDRESRQNAGARRKKKTAVTAALMAMTLGSCAAAPTARVEAVETTEAQSKQAAETRSADSGKRAAGAALSSRGSFVYCGDGTGAQIYAADFFLLRDKLDSIPDMVFEPTRYTHTHQWEYRDINEKTHTRHCGSCGDKSDVVNAHKTQRRVSCTLSHNGEEYPGIRYTCVCGYQWEQEASHTLSFEAVDENVHRSRCCLDGTEYCPGYEPVTEEHYAYFYEPCEDGLHHVKVCMDCGYRHEETCSFILSDGDDSIESGGAEGGGNSSGDGSVEGGGNGETDSEGAADGSGRRCLCGNVERPDTDTGKDSVANSKKNPGESPADAETRDGTGETPSGAEADDETTETESGENSSDTETGEKNTDAENGEAPSDTETGGEIIEENVDEAVGRIFAGGNADKKIMESLLYENKGRKRGAV